MSRLMDVSILLEGFVAQMRGRSSCTEPTMGILNSVSSTHLKLLSFEVSCSGFAGLFGAARI